MVYIHCKSYIYYTIILQHSRNCCLRCYHNTVNRKGRQMNRQIDIHNKLKQSRQTYRIQQTRQQYTKLLSHETSHSDKQSFSGTSTILRNAPMETRIVHLLETFKQDPHLTGNNEKPAHAENRYEDIAYRPPPGKETQAL